MYRNRKDIIQLHDELNRPLVMDGAIGSLLQQRKVETHKTLWSSYANIAAPEKVIEVHNEYINAGAEIITTNTFRTNPIAYNQASLEISNSEFIKRSVELSIEAVRDTNVIVAGSNAPAEDSYNSDRKVTPKEVELNHKYHIDMLWKSGVDLVLNETQSHFDEIKIICEHCNLNKIPFIVSLFVTGKGKILSGESFDEIIKYVSDFNPIAVGINCVTPETFDEIFLGMETTMRWGFYLNCGSGNFTDSEIFEGVTPTNYIDIVNRKFRKEPLFIGSCCGSSPEHTKSLKEYLIAKN
jgi:methionine synthase I (cobalamin-dependent)